MATLFLIGAGAGFVSAALFASAATATALAGVLFYLAPLPICLAGLGWGWMAAAIPRRPWAARRGHRGDRMVSDRTPGWMDRRDRRCPRRHHGTDARL